MTPESGRIPGSNNDFFCAQRWIDVSNDSMGVTIVCPQGALWEVGDMVDERKVNPGRGTNPELLQGLEDRGEEQQHHLPLRPQQLLAHQLQGRPGRADHLRPLPEDARAVQAGGSAEVRAGDDAALDRWWK
ncbi:MAG: hypothetical protein IPG10_17210 [Flavobacteriales bacterium]|nr:hypothetical protein [Flavobacteriales bacterium]